MSVEQQPPVQHHPAPHSQFDIDLATDPIQIGSAPPVPPSHPQHPTYTSIPPHPDTVTTATDPVVGDTVITLIWICIITCYMGMNMSTRVVIFLS